MVEVLAQSEVPRRGEKSRAAFRTISEVAVELDLPQHVLRFWETKFLQVRPLKRGGGRRYYRPEDLALLRRIRRLLYDEGYTIKGVQKLLREDGPAAHAVVAAPPAKVEPPRAEDRLRDQLRAALAEIEAARRLLDETG